MFWPIFFVLLWGWVCVWQMRLWFCRQRSRIVPFHVSVDMLVRHEYQHPPVAPPVCEPVKPVQQFPKVRRTFHFED
jgi:hypothetical protein